MTLEGTMVEGTVINGVIVLDDKTSLPEGARVRVKLTEAEVDLDDLPVPPPSTETYEEHLAALRQSIEETKAGIGRMTLDEFAAELKKEFGLPSTVKR